MSDQFKTYAKFYDLLYKDKNYSGEAAYIHELISRFQLKKPADLAVLDLACGTGKHLLELAGLGYQLLSGSDISASMIEGARTNAKNAGKDIDFYNFSFQESNRILPKKFDVVLSMFSAVNYITSLDDQLKTFQHVFNLLEDQGLFIFDYWNGNAVVRDYSPVKVLRKQAGQDEIIRISNTKIDLITQGAEVLFNCLYLENKELKAQFEELHKLHYYFFSEMEALLKSSGFRLLSRLPFMQDKPVESHDWNISIVAQKIK